MAMTCPFRVGIGTDLHRVATRGGPVGGGARSLRLGGVDISSDIRLVGHSDADVVLHAVIDAMFGAAGLPDIGETYPDSDPAYRGADSVALLRDAAGRVAAAGFDIVNLDVVIHAESPKLSPYRETMSAAVADVLGVSAAQVNVKAKTGEGVDAVGRSEAIACTAVVLLCARPA